MYVPLRPRFSCHSLELIHSDLLHLFKSCTLKRDMTGLDFYVKEFSRVRMDPSQSIIIDNQPISYSLNKGTSENSKNNAHTSWQRARSRLFPESRNR